MRQNGNSKTVYGGKAFRLFAAVLCLLFTAPFSFIHPAAAGDATLEAVSGPLNQVIEAHNATTAYASKERQPELSGDDDSHDHALAVQPADMRHPLTVATPVPHAPTVRLATPQHASHGTRAPPISLRIVT